VVWNTAAQNIFDAQIVCQIDVRNRDFLCVGAPSTGDEYMRGSIWTLPEVGQRETGLR